MAGITERNQMKNELAGMGYSLKYIDEWQPKSRLYRHKAAYTTDGEIADAVGTYMDNVPGSPDYVLRKSRIGLFTWPPSETCPCKWCVEQRVAEGDVVMVGALPTTSSPQLKKMRRTGPYLEQS